MERVFKKVGHLLAVIKVVCLPYLKHQCESGVEALQCFNENKREAQHIDYLLICLAKWQLLSFI